MFNSVFKRMGIHNINKSCNKRIRGETLMEKILILGGSGLIGKALINELNKCNKFEIYETYFEHPMSLNQDRSFKLDIGNVHNIDDILETLKPQKIISCLRGDFDQQLILHKQAAEYLMKTGGKLYFFSTTNVFDNDLSRPHYEDDFPCSCTDYGQYKIECEKIITETLQDRACILRIPQVWGKDSPRMKHMIELLTDNKEVVVYPELFLNSNTDVMIAKQTTYILNHNLSRIFHLAAEDTINSKDFYYKLIKELGFNHAKLNENFEESGYFALLSKRSCEFTSDLRVTNQTVINYLTH